jgi:SAM-dependent methyltransferase
MGSIKNLVPAAVRRVLRRRVRAAQDRFTNRGSRRELQDYWRRGVDAGNRPSDYIEGEARSRLLLRLVAGLPSPPARILEIGSNVGRNLHYLFENGRRDLEGIEINEAAVDEMKRAFPGVGAAAVIHRGPVEDVIRTLPDRRYDLVFSMAVFEHIHTDSDWVFGEIARTSAHHILTIEDEECVSPRHFPRNYRRVFEAHAFRQVHEEACDAVAGLGAGFVARVFERA